MKRIELRVILENTLMRLFAEWPASDTHLEPEVPANYLFSGDVFIVLKRKRTPRGALFWQILTRHGVLWALENAQRTQLVTSTQA